MVRKSFSLELGKSGQTFLPPREGISMKWESPEMGEYPMSGGATVFLLGFLVIKTGIAAVGPWVKPEWDASHFAG